MTPDRLQGRMNATMRSLNRGMIVVGAPVGGLLGDVVGYRPALWAGVVGFLAVTLALGLSPFRHARHTDPAPDADLLDHSIERGAAVGQRTPVGP